MMKLINNLKKCVSNFIGEVKYGTMQKVLLLVIYLTMILFFFSMPSFSYNYLHKIPVLLMVILSIEIFIYQILFEKIFVDKNVIYLIFFVLTVLFSCLINGFERFNTSYIVLPVMFMVLYQFLSNNKMIFKCCIKCLIFGIIAFSLVYILYYFDELITLNFDRLGYFFGDENVIGNYFSLGLLLCFHSSLFEKKYFYLLPSIVFLFLGFTTGSKAFILTASLIILIVIILFFGKERWYFSLSIFFVGLALVIIVLQIPAFSSFKTRILDFIKLFITGNYSADVSTGNRLYYIFEGFFYFLKNLSFGLGVSGYEQYSFYGQYSHNNVIELLANFGLLSCIFFEAPVFLALSKIKSKDKKIKSLNFGFFATIFIGMITVVQFLDKFYFLQLAFFCSLYRIECNPKDYLTLSKTKNDLLKSEKIRVIQFIPSFEGVGGAEKFLLDLCKKFDKNKIHLILVSLYEKPLNTPLLDDLENLDIIYLDKKLGFDLSIIKKIRKIIRKFNPDILHTHLNTLSYVYFASIGFNKVIIHTVHNEANKEVTKVNQMLHYMFFKLGRCFPIGISNKISQTIENCYHIRNVDCIYNGIDFAKFKSNYPLSERKIDFVHVGRFFYQKNHELLIESFELVIKKYPYAKLYLIGSGELFEQVQKNVEDKNLSANVVFCGSIKNDEVKDILINSKFFILSSRFEGNPISLLEAMASGCYPICTNVGGISDIIINENYGILVEQNKESISMAIIDALENIEIYESRQKDVSESIKKFDMVNVCEQYYLVYSKYLKRD